MADQNITRLLRRWRAGDNAALDQLTPLIYLPIARTRGAHFPWRDDRSHVATNGTRERSAAEHAGREHRLAGSGPFLCAVRAHDAANPGQPCQRQERRKARRRQDQGSRDCARGKCDTRSPLAISHAARNRFATASGNATPDEAEFLSRLRFKGNRPGPLYYYRELQSLRDPLHFRDDERV